MERQSFLELRRRETATYQALVRFVRLIESQMGRLFDEIDIEGITPAQSQVLMVLVEAKEPLTTRELARRLSVSDVTMGRFVKALEAHGWVHKERSTEDRRAFLVRPTQKVYDTLPKFIVVVREILDTVFGPVGVDKVEEIYRGVRAAEKRLHALDGPPKAWDRVRE